jgi:hypothetical protein
MYLLIAKEDERSPNQDDCSSEASLVKTSVKPSLAKMSVASEQ